MRRRVYGNPDENQKGIVDLARSIDAKVEITTGVGGGFPDLVIGFRNQTHLAEIKKPGEDLRKSQQLFVQRWPAPVWKIETGQQLVDALLKADRTERGHILMLLREARMDYEDGNIERCMMWMPQLLQALDAMPGLIAQLDLVAP